MMMKKQPTTQKEMHVRVDNGKPMIPVSSFEEASLKVTDYIAENNFGSRDFGMASVFVNNVFVATISYNGRVWNINKIKTFKRTAYGGPRSKSSVVGHGEFEEITLSSRIYNKLKADPERHRIIKTDSGRHVCMKHQVGLRGTTCDR
jgi:hypothetical protein